MRYGPGGLNCGIVTVNWKTGLVKLPSVTARFCRPKTANPDSCANRIPEPAETLSKPPSSCAAMETVKSTGPALESNDTGETLRLTSCGGTVSAATALANRTNVEAANFHKRAI